MSCWTGRLPALPRYPKSTTASAAPVTATAAVKVEAACKTETHRCRLGRAQTGGERAPRQVFGVVDIKALREREANGADTHTHGVWAYAKAWRERSRLHRFSLIHLGEMCF